MLPPPSLNAIKDLLPVQAEAALSAQIPASEFQLPAAEATAMTTMQPKRRREFINGRICARIALAALGLPDQVIPVGTNREPIWPDGFVGSISHCGQVAMAAAAHSDSIIALGIDMESAIPLDADVLAMICRPEEQSWLRSTDHPLQYAKVIFSAKESIYKCIWPMIRRFVDFQDIRIQIDLDTGGFVPIEWTDSLPGSVIQCIAGRYLLQDGWITTTACISQRTMTSDLKSQ